MIWLLALGGAYLLVMILAGLYVADQKHRSLLEGVLFGITLGPLGLILVACLESGQARTPFWHLFWTHTSD